MHSPHGRPPLSHSPLPPPNPPATPPPSSPQVEAKALGLEVLGGVTPQVQFVKVVNDELVELMGSAGNKDLEPPVGGEGSPQVVLLAGLQGVGKTTAAGKLALFMAKRRKKVGRVYVGALMEAGGSMLQGGVWRAVEWLDPWGAGVEVQSHRLRAVQGTHQSSKVTARIVCVHAACTLQVCTHGSLHIVAGSLQHLLATTSGQSWLMSVNLASTVFKLLPPPCPHENPSSFSTPPSKARIPTLLPACLCRPLLSSPLPPPGSACCDRRVSSRCH